MNINILIDSKYFASPLSWKRAEKAAPEG